MDTQCRDLFVAITQLAVTHQTSYPVGRYTLAPIQAIRWFQYTTKPYCSDDSISIARRYAEQDSRFVVKEIANRGLGGARNAAMDVARGEYLFFMDSD